MAGLDYLREVDLVVLEIDGRIGILTYDFRQHNGRQRQALVTQSKSKVPSRN